MVTAVHNAVIYTLHYSLSGKTSYCQISWSLGAAGLDIMLIVSLSNLTVTLVALLAKCLSNSERMAKSKPESRGFETSRNLVVIRLAAQRIDVLSSSCRISPGTNHICASRSFYCNSSSEYPRILRISISKTFQSVHISSKRRFVPPVKSNDLTLIIVLDVGRGKSPGGRLNKKDGLTRYGNSHVKDKTS